MFKIDCLTRSGIERLKSQLLGGFLRGILGLRPYGLQSKTLECLLLLLDEAFLGP